MNLSDAGVAGLLINEPPLPLFPLRKVLTVTGLVVLIKFLEIQESGKPVHLKMASFRYWYQSQQEARWVDAFLTLKENAVLPSGQITPKS